MSNILAHTAPMEIHRATATDAERAEFRAHLGAVAPRDTDAIARHRVERARVVESLRRIPERAPEVW